MSEAINRVTSMPIVIDCDPGIDDVVALALAARSPALELVAVTSTYGNATLADTTRNAREILARLDSEVNVLPGADRPRMRPLHTTPETHGPTGVGYADVPAATTVTPNPTVLLDVLAELDDPVTLVTLGPLTNLSYALEADGPLVHSRVRRHLGMFGSLRERGNTNRWADFNSWCDPEATATVLEAALGTEMVGLDVTRRMTFPTSVVERLATSPDAVVAWLAQALQFYVEFHRSQERLDGCVVNDVLPIGELIHAGVLSYQDVELLVDLDDGEHRGHTRERNGGTVTRVALGVDVPRMRVLLERVFGSGWSDEAGSGGGP